MYFNYIRVPFTNLNELNSYDELYVELNIT